MTVKRMHYFYTEFSMYFYYIILCNCLIWMSVWMLMRWTENILHTNKHTWKTHVHSFTPPTDQISKLVRNTSIIFRAPSGHRFHPLLYTSQAKSIETPPNAVDNQAKRNNKCSWGSHKMILNTLFNIRSDLTYYQLPKRSYCRIIIIIVNIHVDIVLILLNIVVS